MQEHIIELSNRYQLKLNASLNYTVCKIEHTPTGVVCHGEQVCKDLFGVVDTLMYCEIMNEDVTSLADIAAKLADIYGEVKRIAEIQETYAYA